MVFRPTIQPSASNRAAIVMSVYCIGVRFGKPALSSGHPIKRTSMKLTVLFSIPSVGTTAFNDRLAAADVRDIAHLALESSKAHCRSREAREASARLLLLQ